MSNLPTSQKLIVQSRSQASPTGKLPLAVAIEQPLPELQTEYDVLVRVLAAGLNPIDCKMVSHFYVEGQSVGCDFCGIVELTGHASSLAVGDRIFAGVLPYGFDSKRTGAFSQYAVVDSRRALQVPHDWSDTLAAGLGLLSWTTVALAMSKPDALALCGKPSTPVTTAIPVLVYGGGTATGVVAIQMLKQSGYTPIAVCSDQSAARAMACGALGTASYRDPHCVQKVLKLANGIPIKHCLDCITQPDSVEICFAALARVGAHYTCLEDCPEAWRPRRSVKVSVIMAYEQMGFDCDLGDTVYTRKANPQSAEIVSLWAAEVKDMLATHSIKPLPVRELVGDFYGIIQGLEEISKNQVKGHKLVTRISY